MANETTVAPTVNQLRRPDFSVRAARLTAASRRIGLRALEMRRARVVVPAAASGLRNTPGAGAGAYRGGESRSAEALIDGKVQVPAVFAAQAGVCGDGLPASELQIRAYSDTLVSDRVDRSVFRCVRCGEFEREVEVADPVIRSGPVVVTAARASGAWRSGAAAGAGAVRAGFSAIRGDVTAGNSLALRAGVIRTKGRLPIAGRLREFDRGGIVIARPVDPVGELTDSAVSGNPIEKRFRSWDGKMVLVATDCVREFDDVAHGPFTRVKRTVNVIRKDVIDASPWARQVPRAVLSGRRQRIPSASRG
jgi:hypothetical protein